MNRKIHNRLAVDKVLICISTNPYRHIIKRWNWKSACLSAVSRGILILLANLSAGGSSAAGAMAAEVCYRGLTSGFYSALTQAFRFAQPAWAASTVPMIIVPIIADGFEVALHGLRGTQRLGATAVASVVFTVVSTFFELFAMRRGVLVMGGNSRPLIEDLKQVPGLIADFWAEIRHLPHFVFSLSRKLRLLGARSVRVATSQRFIRLLRSPWSGRGLTSTAPIEP